ncbi:unnamed protein product [Prunus armeniaca]
MGARGCTSVDALLCFLTRTNDRKRLITPNNDVPIGVARSLVTPRDVSVMRTRDDNQLVSDAMAPSV